jgi:hypothetical protein
MRQSISHEAEPFDPLLSCVSTWLQERLLKPTYPDIQLFLFWTAESEQLGWTEELFCHNVFFAYLRQKGFDLLGFWFLEFLGEMLVRRLGPHALC